ncbi:exodeoxyribonuclease VII large subunit [Insolitispirillum peregrinum]|uniref:Exodeoxyribonuclease 7 large subunit n=1 Tax=Insolitispirillum peregrinum TaxID=80876 RepID=A0A1N7L8E2_9PROT|nr:exodeoxyribonuclease VII large subunit [Insolitispirillum peregrinum]SIS70077.1 Exodeoxyribonuclease VII large subunit [Insolitispirillum peregrinum]
MTSPADDRGLFEAAAPSANAEHSHNAPARSVSELSAALKRTVEETYSHVRVRGEISQPKLAGSGHCYLRLKDDSAVIDAIIWRGSYSRLSVRPEEGLEVIAVGRLTTYPGRSSYQIVIESMELAGQGALLKMLEERRRRLAAEGLFAPERKRPLPFLPRTIGVITSPTGAVIRDILHRLNDRFPVHVLVWPVLVQGEGAAQQVARAVAGFNALPADGRGAVPRPDVLIVARGGGSLEDLMAFNEELVVRAVAASDIPVISAVGHETDTTLCDFAADLRAPTPTGAAEMVVPVRLDLLAQVHEGGQRLTGSLRRLIAERAMRLEGLARGLPPIERLLEEQVQRLDERSERLTRAGRGYLDRRLAEVRHLGAALRSPREQIAAKQAQLGQTAAALRSASDYLMRDQATRLGHLTTRLRPDGVLNGMARAERDLEGLGQRQHQAFERRLADLSQRLTAASERLQASSHEAVLRRGYALVRDEQGAVLSGQAAAVAAGAVRVQFHDGDVSAQVHGPLDDGSAPGPAEPPARRPAARKGKAGDGRQESLF